MLSPPEHCPLCDTGSFETLFEYHAAPAGETKFELPAGSGYERRIYRCRSCRHCVSVGSMDLDRFYEGQYVNSTYGAGLRSAFDRIMALDPKLSDNVQRVRRIENFFSSPERNAVRRRLLDVGSGLCVFPAKMKELGWECTAVDPDGEACAHAQNVVHVNAVRGDFLTLSGLGRFSLVTFNKVLEHVADPVGFLRRAETFLDDGGIVYLEVPDADAAARLGSEREEFFIEHLHVFSSDSLENLISKAGFRLLNLEQLVEPSTKCTLLAFIEIEREQKTR